MTDAKYIGLDVHQATISVAVLDSTGKLMMESILETKAATILQFFQGLRGSVYVALEEGTCAAWLHDLLQPHVTKVLVCDPRKNSLLKAGNKSDRIDARKLADLLRTGLLSPVYHGDNGLRTLRELARSYLAVTQDLTRVMNRLKALYRSWAIPCAGQQVYAPRYRSEWLGKITAAGVRRRAELYYQQLDALALLHQQVRRDLLAESRKHSAVKLLRQIPLIGTGSSPDRSDSNPPSFSHQTATLGLQRFGFENLQQRGIPFCRGATQKIQKTPGHSGTQHKP